MHFYRKALFAAGVMTLVLVCFFGITHDAYAANTIVSQQYLDMNQNGVVDHIGLTFDTNLTACNYDAADWTINTAGSVNITAITGFEGDGSCSGGSPVLFLIVTSGSTYTGGTTAPVVSYANAGTANSLQDSGVITAKPSLTLTDGAKPIISSITLSDSNADGLADGVVFNWSEPVDTDDGSAPVAADLPATVLPDGLTADFSSAVISDPAGTSSSVTVTGVTGQVTVNTGAGSAAISGDLSARWKDTNNNVPHAAAATGQETVTETMAPLVVSSTPSSGGSGITRSSNITLVFSENISSLTWSISPSTTLTNATSLPASTITLTGVKLSGTNTFTILTAPDSSANAFDQFMSTSTTAISFTVAASSTSTTSAPVYDIALTSPTELSTVYAAQPVSIVWSTSGSTGTIGAVTIACSLDGGTTWTTIVTNTTNDGSYEWDVPENFVSDSVVLSVEGTDLISVLATDTSDTFSIVARESGVLDEGTLTGEDASSVPSAEYEGKYIKGNSWTTVYFVEGSLRHPFLDTQTYLTYEDDFDAVITVADDVLSEYAIGAPMLPKAGVVLVKIQSLEKVFAVGDGAMLHWIESESAARGMYGDDWAEYVIDVPVTAWGHFTVGKNVDDAGDLDINLDVMKTREEVSR